MFKVTKYPHGTFSWVDCSSTDAAAATKFYTEVMGWTTEDFPIPGTDSVYTMFKHDGITVAAISAADPSAGTPSYWTSYVTVDDVDTLAGKVAGLGGTLAMEPMDVMEEGRMVLLLDPEGAAVALWQPKNHIGAGMVNAPGAFCWNELAARDPEKAKAFYGGLLGWQFESGPMEGYTMIMNKGRANGGIIKMTEEWGDMPSHWMIYFSVADLDAASAKVKSAGGEVKHGPMDAEGVGRFSVIADPAGAVCTIMQPQNPDPWTE